MLVKAGGFELEINENSFVCLMKGDTSHFCEWSRMDTGLQETFRGLKKDVSKLIEEFLQSEKTRSFLVLSDSYEDTSCKGCR